MNAKQTAKALIQVIQVKFCTNHRNALVLFRRRMDSFGRPIWRYSRTVNDVVASSHHVVVLAA
jgi:hypothetical protein